MSKRDIIRKQHGDNLETIKEWKKNEIEYRKHDMPVYEYYWLKTKHISFIKNGAMFIYTPHDIYQNMITKTMIRTERKRGFIFNVEKEVHFHIHGEMYEEK